MGNTANNNWPYPESTDLVKDGATAIENLADAIDTTLGVYADPGLVLINTTSFSGVASQALTADTFTSAYDNYLIVLKLSAATSDANVFLKMRASGVDSSVNYYYAYLGLTSSNITLNKNGSNVTDGFLLSEVDTGSSAKPTFVRFEIYNPKIAEPTSLILQASISTTAGTPFTLNGGGVHTPSTAYDSANFISSDGNISGSITVYGMNK
jgi:hypothetical protein